MSVQEMCDLSSYFHLNEVKKQSVEKKISAVQGAIRELSDRVIKIINITYYNIMNLKSHDIC